MKKLALVLIVCVACSEEQIKDPFIGDWEYTPSGLPVDIVSFQLLLDESHVYDIDSLEVDGEEWPIATISNAEKGKKIGQLAISEHVESGMTFYNIHAGNGVLVADSVIYGEGMPRVYTTLYNQSITKR